MELKEKIIELYENSDSLNKNEFYDLANTFLNYLNTGKIRAAEKQENGNWKVNIWVKYGILLIFKYSRLIEKSKDDIFKFFDKDLLDTHPFELSDKVRIVPGGSTIRIGSYIAPGVICMPPMYVNIGAYVEENTMIDSHALVGTCAQIGKNVHLSAASQIGGVLEPPGARPVIVEDNVMIGGNCGIYEGALIRERAVLGSGVILTSSTKVYDIVNNRVIHSSSETPLEIPSGAVVIPGTRKLKSEFANEYGLSIASPIIIKYRDDKTDAKTALEEALR